MADRTDFATAVGALIKGRSPVGHTHPISGVDGLEDVLADLEAATGVTIRNLGTTDLNDAVTVGGFYVQGANAAALPERHYPSKQAGVMEVLPYSVVNSDRVIQRYTGWQTFATYQRSLFNGVWSEWQEQGADWGEDIAGLDARIDVAEDEQAMLSAYVSKRLGDTVDADILAAITDQDGTLTDLTVRSSDGQVPDWVMGRWQDRLGLGDTYAHNILASITDADGAMTDLTVRASDGQVPDWVIDRWRERIGVAPATTTAPRPDPVAPLLQSIAGGVERHVAGTPLQSTVVDLTTADTQPARVIFPDRYSDTRPMPLIISFMGIGGSINSHWSYTDLRPKLSEAGVLMAGGVYGGDLYGAPAMMASARELWDQVLRMAPVNGVVLYGNSMGGIGALNALTTGAIPNVLGVYLVDPTYDLRHRWDNGRDTEIGPAYGIAADGSDYDEKTAGYDPALRPLEDFRRVPIRVYSSDGDSLWHNHAVKLAERLSATNDVTVHNTGTPGHNTTDRFDGTDLAATITEWVGGSVALRP